MTSCPPDHASDTIVITNACVDFSGNPLFDRLNVTLAPQRTTCIIGPSGVGKSSLLRLIAGLPPNPTSGSARDGDGQELDGRVAYMAQEDLLLPWARVLDNVTLGSRLRGEQVDYRRAAALINAVGLAEYEDALPRSLSGGMRQRVALARTLMEERPIILMDEPFSALDALTRYQVQELAAELLAGRTVVLVTHDPLEALRLGHVIHVMTGRPACLNEALCLADDPPRDTTRPDIVDLQRELLAELGFRPDSAAPKNTTQVVE